MMQIDGKDLIAEVAAQRNRALDEAANYAAQVKTLMGVIAKLEERLKALGPRAVEEPPGAA